MVLFFFLSTEVEQEIKIYEMIRIALLLFLLFPLMLPGQVRLSKLTVSMKKSYEITSSYLLDVDTLVMEDSSRIILNHNKRENFIRIKVVIIGNYCTIVGHGMNGTMGKNGAFGRTYSGPCRDGSTGKDGTDGQDGQPGVNLFLYLDKIIVNGILVLDLAGGNGGDGGNGGEGGGGSPGTLHCDGGDGGRGGNAGSGGDGGQGGSLNFGGLDMESMRLMLGTQIIVNTLGGDFGYGGLPGNGGSAGLGPAKKDGRAGKNGSNGERGKPGVNGGIQFEQQ